MANYIAVPLNVTNELELRRFLISLVAQLDSVIASGSVELNSVTQANTAKIKTNTDSIAQNTSDIIANAGNIAQNTADIATDKIAIAKHTSEINTNITHLATHDEMIRTNEANIVQDISSPFGIATGII